MEQLNNILVQLSQELFCILQIITQFILKAGRAYELTNCFTTFTTFSELSLLRGERQELERSGREDNEKSLGENSVDILLTGELHSEGRGHLPSAYQSSVLTRVRMIMPLALKSGVWRRYESPLLEILACPSE